MADAARAGLTDGQTMGGDLQIEPGKRMNGMEVLMDNGRRWMDRTGRMHLTDRPRGRRLKVEGAPEQWSADSYLDRLSRLYRWGSHRMRSDCWRGLMCARAATSVS
jgi:hypothetical protein